MNLCKDKTDLVILPVKKRKALRKADHFFQHATCSADTIRRTLNVDRNSVLSNIGSNDYAPRNFGCDTKAL